MKRALLIAALCSGLLACAAREQFLPQIGLTPPALRDFPADFKPPASHETGESMPGFGGDGELTRTPVIFIHGNTVSARFWLPAREHFLKSGYKPAELWALGYGWDNARYFDSNDLSVPSVERIVSSVTRYLEQKTGRPVPQVDIISHSLGVTLVRQWMKQNNAWHRVRNYVGAAGASDGVWTAWMDARTQSRVVSFELAPGSPWLRQLDRGGQTPGPTNYMTLYDGTGWYDVLFPKPSQDSGALEGATNLAFNRERGTYHDHLALPREPDTMDAMIEFLRRSPEPLPEARRPNLVRQGGQVRADQADAKVYCASRGEYPNNKSLGHESVELPEGILQTCYAHSLRTGLSSPMARYLYAPDYRGSGELSLSADVRAGPHEQPQFVRLKASDPRAFIVYTTSGAAPDSGSPLYDDREPVYVPGPLTLKAVAIAPDGRRSAVLERQYDISLEYVEARRSLERQFDPDAPVYYSGRRTKGR